MKPKTRSFIDARFLLILCLIFISACQLESKHNEMDAGAASKPLVDPKYSLTQDRSELDQLREAIPEDKKRANDEKSLLAEWMLGLKKSPADIRDKYENLVRKKREAFNKDMTKARENYTKAQEKKRTAFLKDLETQRKDFADQKKSRDEKNDFFSSLDEKRRSFFSEERENRDEFESNVRDQRKNFEDYLNEKRLDFTSEMKAYTEKWKAQEAEQQKNK